MRAPSPRRLGLIGVAVAVLAAASVAWLLTRGDPSVQSRLAGMLSRSSCSSVDQVRGTPTATQAPFSAERRLARRATRVDFVFCNEAGGSLDVLRFADTVTLQHALALTKTTSTLCRTGRTLIVDALLSNHSPIADYCHRLHGTIVRPR